MTAPFETFGRQRQSDKRRVTAHTAIATSYLTVHWPSKFLQLIHPFLTIIRPCQSSPKRLWLFPTRLPASLLGSAVFLSILAHRPHGYSASTVEARTRTTEALRDTRMLVQPGCTNNRAAGRPTEQLDKVHVTHGLTVGQPEARPSIPPAASPVQLHSAVHFGHQPARSRQGLSPPLLPR